MKSSDELEKTTADEEEESEAPLTQSKSCLLAGVEGGYDDSGGPGMILAIKKTWFRFGSIRIKT